MAGKVNDDKFLEIPSSRNKERSGDCKGVVCIGYPGHLNIINYDNQSYAVAPNAVWGIPCEQLISDRASFKPLNQLPYAPDGMSGGPVFSLLSQSDMLTIELCGILTNASSEAFNYLPLKDIYKLLSYATA